MSVAGNYIFPVEAYTNDFRGKPTLHMLGGFLMQAATRHAEERGFGYFEMARHKKAWVLSRLAMEMSVYPVNDHCISIHTWVPEVNKLFTERCFALSDSVGNHIGDARSLWAAIDMETRKPTNIQEMEGFDQFTNRKQSPIENVRKIPPVKEKQHVESFVVKYSDLDINSHLNSMKYIEHFVNTFPLEMFRTKNIRRFEICFMSEGRYDARLDIFRRKESEDTFILEMRNVEKIISSARVKWE
ncbi:MAG: acyl-[acyl-carrier-protein] thioesterase [Bacteroidales bacterium]|jgi:acyl-ACP thioesterase|nr:acyl-[acyl-carrier-protein] thioesterase [Bacteroidales bacterium]